ncbi:MAG TPA: FeoB small GTPase domain-containing protein, partial [Clostridia bacterium]
MGLTNQSTGSSLLGNNIVIDRSSFHGSIIALSGNPNVGKSTVFNSLTGLNQHTGNWPGKTVATCYGKYRHKNKDFILVDIPGTYSLMANSAEEEVARDFVCFENPDATVVITDATCLERNLNLVLQTLEITDKVIVCVNLIDEAERKKININCKKLSDHLGVPVIATNARSGRGLDELIDTVHNITLGIVRTNPLKITYDETIEQAIELVRPILREITDGKTNDRWVSLKLLDGDVSMLESLN